MALTNPWDKTKIGLQIERETVERERGEEKREEEEEEEKKRKAKQKGMELTLVMDQMNFVWNSRNVYEFQT